MPRTNKRTNMKKLLYLFLFTGLFFALNSCSDDDNNNNIKIYVAESYNADGSANLVQTETLNALVGFGCTFTIKGGSGSYTVTSENEDIAVVEPNADVKGEYYISTKGVLGSTVIKVDDGNGEIISVPFAVNSYRIEISIRKTYAAIVVEEGVTFDENIRKQINEDVDACVIPAGNVFALTYNEPSSGSLYISGDGSTKYDGTFTQTRTNSYDWTVFAKYNDKEYQYLLSKIELVTKATDLVKMDIIEDMTDIYKEKYPEAGIKKVYAVMEGIYKFNP